MKGTANLHDFSTRAGQNRHHRRAGTAAEVVAVLILVAAVTILAPAIANSAQPTELELSALPETTATGAEADASHDLAIEIVEPGKESLELTARLTDDGGLIERALSWTITASNGETVFSGEAPEAAIAVPPGDYDVVIKFGAVTLRSSVTLLEANKLMVSYVLNAGGIRILPRVKDIGLPAARPNTRVFALGGRQNGKLVATSALAGEILRVPAGDYRIETGFETGNVKAVTEVHVYAGKLSALDIDHKAGLARLAFVGAPDAAVDWQVTDSDGKPIIQAAGLNADMVLKPGTYRAEAHVAGETLTATFAIAVGETRDIILGN